MKKKLILIISIVTIFLVKGFAFQSDLAAELAANFKNGDVKNISKRFASTIELTLNGEEDDYNKTQAELILSDFFSKYHPTKASITHKIETNPNYRYCVLLLNTQKENFRVSITLNKINNEFQIVEIEIENSKG